MIQSTILLKQCLSYIWLEFLVYHLILRLKKKNSHNHNYKVYTCIPHITDRKVKLQDGHQIIQAEICFSFIGFPEGSAAEESTSNVVDIEDIGFVSGLERAGWGVAGGTGRWAALRAWGRGWEEARF